MKTSESLLATRNITLSVSLIKCFYSSQQQGWFGVSLTFDSLYPISTSWRGGEGFKAHEVLKVIKAPCEKALFLLIVAAAGSDTRHWFRPSNVFKNINLILLGENAHYEFYTLPNVPTVIIRYIIY